MAVPRKPVANTYARFSEPELQPSYGPQSPPPQQVAHQQYQAYSPQSPVTPRSPSLPHSPLRQQSPVSQYAPNAPYSPHTQYTTQSQYNASQQRPPSPPPARPQQYPAIAQHLDNQQTQTNSYYAGNHQQRTNPQFLDHQQYQTRSPQSPAPQSQHYSGYPNSDGNRYSSYTQQSAQPPRPPPSVGTVEFEKPEGWKYKRPKLGPIKLPWYASPESQLLLVSFVCFLCPGMFNALNGLGGAGQLSNNSYASSASNSALYAAFAVVGFFAGTVINKLGIRMSLAFGGLGYCVYVGAYLCFNQTSNFGFVVFAGLLLGCCAGILWSAQGTIMMSYPPERLKGRFISWFWIIFNSGAVIGSLGSLGFNINKSGDQSVSNATYIGFIILTFLGACLSWTLVDAKHVVRKDGSRIILMKHPTWKSEFIGLWETLWNDPYIMLLFPMFFASNWFYTYQFQNVNLARFNTRTRALNSALYWLAQMLGALSFGFGLDFPNIRRTTRAKVAWAAIFVLTFAIWGGGYVFQRDYTREDTAQSDHFVYDWTTKGYVGPLFLYILYGFYDAAWQTCVYWFMGAITNNSRKLANFAGFYKGIQSAGAAIVWSLDEKKISYMSMFISCFVLLAGSLVIALPVMVWKIKDTVPVEEDLKFTDETIDDVIGYSVQYTSVQQDKR